MKIKKLLFVTKFEDLCYDALKSLLVLGQADLEHVVFLNVIERDKVAMRRGNRIFQRRGGQAQGNGQYKVYRLGGKPVLNSGWKSAPILRWLILSMKFSGWWKGKSRISLWWASPIKGQ